MLKVLFSFIFKLIAKLAEIVLSPITALITAFIPDLGQTLNNITLFITTGLQSVPFWIHFFAIPTGAFAIFFTYILGKATFWLGYRATKFVIKIYQKFKP